MHKLFYPFAFLAGFCNQFNILIGAKAVSFGEVGAYGYRLSDLFAIACCLGLVALSLETTRVVAVTLFSCIVGLLFVPAIYGGDAVTSTLAAHYILYSLAAVFIGYVLKDRQALRIFCYGLIIGLVGSVGLMAVVASGLFPTQTLAGMGLTAGYAAEFGGYIRETPRSSGLWGHPNEAGHVATLAAGAAAFLYTADRRLVPLAVTGAAFLAVFYFTLCRAGFAAGVIVLMLALLIPAYRRGFGSGLIAVVLIGAFVFAANLDVLGARLADDANATDNARERLTSSATGIWLALEHPFGQSLTDFSRNMSSFTAVETPHNGFIFAAAILGIPTFFVLLSSMVANLFINYRSDEWQFYAFLMLQIAVSFFFEQLAGSISYIMIIGLLLGRVFLNSRFGVPYSIGSMVPPSPEPQLAEPAR